jgi:hypothetical protein
VQSFAKKANQTLNYVIGKIFGGGKKTEPKVEENVNDNSNGTNTNTNNTNVNSSPQETAKIDFTGDVKFEKKGKK